MIQFLKDISIGVLIGFTVDAFVLFFAFIGSNIAKMLLG